MGWCSHPTGCSVTAPSTCPLQPAALLAPARRQGRTHAQRLGERRLVAPPVCEVARPCVVLVQESGECSVLCTPQPAQPTADEVAIKVMLRAPPRVVGTGRCGVVSAVGPIHHSLRSIEPAVLRAAVVLGVHPHALLIAHGGEERGGGERLNLMSRSSLMK